MKRPLPVTIIGWLFIIAGAIGFLYHIAEVDMQDPFADDAVWILVIRLIAVLGGILLLRGVNAGRWIIIAWMTYHVILGFLHPPQSLAMHALLLIVLALTLFNARVNTYFR